MAHSAVAFGSPLNGLHGTNAVCRTLSILVVLLLTLVVLAPAQEIKSRPEAVLRQLPIAAGDGEIAQLLRKWAKEGTAAGNVGDWYDNRDGEHSPLDLKPWPQLEKVRYTPEDFKEKVNWAAARKILPIVVFGNSSTSAGPTTGGSNPRQYYSAGKGIEFLANQYVRNNLYIYPEHCDYDPGHNGVGPGGQEGYGDLYPTNTPYLIISQGSSGSDQPFMKAIPYVLAAFRPEVKEALIKSGSLMAAVQMIFRKCNKHLTSDDDYLTGKAHPPVFEGAWVDPLKMVNMAHDITLERLPPVVRVRALADEVVKPGIDYFDPVANENHADTPQCIARIFRGKERWRHMIASAEGSSDPAGKPLKYEWKVLRGDPAGVKIVPKNEAGSIVEIAVRHPERRPVAPGSPMESNRVDLGVFVKNAHHWSAPAFITWQGLDNEIRDYDDNDRVVEISSIAGEVRITVFDWRKVLSKEYASLFPPLTPGQIEALAKLDKERAEFNARVPPPDGDRDIEPFKFKKYDQQKGEFDQKERKKFTETFGATHLPALQNLAKSDLMSNPEFQKRERAAPKAKLDSIAALQKGIKAYDPPFAAAAKDRPITRGMTKFDAEFRELLNAERLNQIVFQGALQVQRHVNYVDPRIAAPHKWRDIYLYDPDGQFVGWARTQPDRKEPAYFTADGLFVGDRDELRRCKNARDVNYAVRADELTWTEGAKVGEYVYAGPNDRRGKLKK